MANEIKNGKEMNNTNKERFTAPDGTIFTTREECLDYVRGLRS